MEKDDITFSFELKDLKLDQLSYLIEESKIF
jgi:hypothetical protein